MGSLWVSSPLVFFCHEGKILIVRQCNHIIWFTILCFSSYLFIAYSILQCDSNTTHSFLNWDVIHALKAQPHVCVLIANPWIGNFVLSLGNCMCNCKFKYVFDFLVSSRPFCCLIWKMTIMSFCNIVWRCSNSVMLQYCLWDALTIVKQKRYQYRVLSGTIDEHPDPPKSVMHHQSTWKREAQKHNEEMQRKSYMMKLNKSNK